MCEVPQTGQSDIRDRCRNPTFVVCGQTGTLEINADITCFISKIEKRRLDIDRNSCLQNGQTETLDRRRKRFVFACKVVKLKLEIDAEIAFLHAKLSN